MGRIVQDHGGCCGGVNGVGILWNNHIADPNHNAERLDPVGLLYRYIVEIVVVGDMFRGSGTLAVV